MSLATSGAGGAGGGAGLSMAAMAHGGPSAMTTRSQTTFKGQQNSNAGPNPSTAAPGNLSALGADLLDKNQNLTWKQIRSVNEMPICAYDLYGNGTTCFFYPKEGSLVKKEQEGEKQLLVQLCDDSSSVNVNGSSLTLKRNDLDWYKALKKVISKSKGYNTFLDLLEKHADNTDKKDAQKDENVTIATPYLLLGARQIQLVRKVTKDNYTCDEQAGTSTTSSAIDTDPTSSSSEYIQITNSNLDGSTCAQNNDFDRVAFNLSLHSSKKSMTILPEEATSLLLVQSKRSVHNSIQKVVEVEDESYLEYPQAIAIPAWACQHDLIDSLQDAYTSHSAEALPPLLYQRSVAAFAGALLPSHPTTKSASGTITNRTKLQPARVHALLLQRFQAFNKAKQKQRQGEDSGPSECCPIVILAGMTDQGVEVSAIQVRSPNFGTDGHCPFGELTVISTVSYQHTKPKSVIAKAFVELSDNLDEMCPELEEQGGVTAIVTYGTIPAQIDLKSSIVKALKSIAKDSDDATTDKVWNEEAMTFVSTREETVSLGTAVLAAVSLGRIDGEEQAGGSSRLRPAIVVKNASPCAVALQFAYHGIDKEWSKPKIIFDYDRRVPTSQTSIELSASECVAIRETPSLGKEGEEEKLVEEAQQKWIKGKYNAMREEAAFDFHVRVIQRVERNGSWVVGDVFRPLTKRVESEDGNAESLAIESSVLELSVDAMGYISCSLTTDGQSISQATKAARTSTFWYYMRIILAIAFFGGFLFKSYWEEASREKCVKRLLAFYKHVVPNSINDGDEHNAHYTCYKYRNKRQKLWKNLESKYGIPVPEAHEWPEDEVEEDEEVDLDEDATDDAKGDEF